MIRWYSAALVPILLWCTPAFAADVATIDCVDKSLNPATTHSISADFQARIESAQNNVPDLPMQEGGASDPAVRMEVDHAAALCGEANGWTIAARAAASAYALKKLALPLFEAAVLNDGIEPAQIARLSKELPDYQSGWEEHQLSDAEKSCRIAVVLTLRLLRIGISLQAPQQMRDVYALAIWHVHLDEARTDFIAA